MRVYNHVCALSRSICIKYGPRTETTRQNVLMERHWSDKKILKYCACSKCSGFIVSTRSKTRSLFYFFIYFFFFGSFFSLFCVICWHRYGNVDGRIVFLNTFFFFIVRFVLTVWIGGEAWRTININAFAVVATKLFAEVSNM